MTDYIVFISPFIFFLNIDYGKGKIIHVDKNTYSNISFVPDDISKVQFLIWSQFHCNFSPKNIPIAYNKD